MTLLQHVRNRPHGFITVVDRDEGTKLFEGEVRQCIHCQYTWRHVPGSGELRGFCKNCVSLTCGTEKCDTCYHKEKQIEDIEAIARQNRASIEAAVRRQNLREQIYTYLKKKG